MDAQEFLYQIVLNRKLSHVMEYVDTLPLDRTIEDCIADMDEDQRMIGRAVLYGIDRFKFCVSGFDCNVLEPMSEYLNFRMLKKGKNVTIKKKRRLERFSQEYVGKFTYLDIMNVIYNDASGYENYLDDFGVFRVDITKLDSSQSQKQVNQITRKLRKKFFGYTVKEIRQGKSIVIFKPRKKVKIRSGIGGLPEITDRTFIDNLMQAKDLQRYKGILDSLHPDELESAVLAYIGICEDDYRNVNYYLRNTKPEFRWFLESIFEFKVKQQKNYAKRIIESLESIDLSFDQFIRSLNEQDIEIYSEQISKDKCPYGVRGNLGESIGLAIAYYLQANSELTLSSFDESDLIDMKKYFIDYLKGESNIYVYENGVRTMCEVDTLMKSGGVPVVLEVKTGIHFRGINRSYEKIVPVLSEVYGVKPVFLGISIRNHDNFVFVDDMYRLSLPFGNKLSSISHKIVNGKMKFEDLYSNPVYN